MINRELKAALNALNRADAMMSEYLNASRTRNIKYNTPTITAIAGMIEHAKFYLYLQGLTFSEADRIARNYLYWHIYKRRAEKNDIV